MPSFSSLYRTIIDPIAADDANTVRARVAQSHPGRQSPLFHNTNYMKQNTPSGSKVREGLAVSAKILDDPITMKVSIARLQHDIISLERETEKALRASTTGGNHAGFKRCLHDHSNTAGPNAPRGVVLRSIPIEDLKTALYGLASYVPEDPNGNAVRLCGLTQLLLTSLDAWAETQIEWLRGYALHVLGMKLPSERELMPLPATAGKAPPPSVAKHPAAAADANAAQAEDGNVSSMLLLSRLLGCSAAEPLVTALLKGVDPATSNAAREEMVKQKVLDMAGTSPARTVSRRRLAAYEQQQEIKEFFRLQQHLAAAGVPGFVAPNQNDLGEDNTADEATQTDESLVRALLRKRRGADGDDSTDDEDPRKSSNSNNKRTPIRTKNVRAALRSPLSSPPLSPHGSSTGCFAPEAPSSAFASNVASRLQLEEACLRIAELERRLLFYKSLESYVAEAEIIGAATDLAFKNDTLASLGLDVTSLVKNYETAVAGVNPATVAALSGGGGGGVASDSDFGNTIYLGSPPRLNLNPGGDAPSSMAKGAATNKTAGVGPAARDGKQQQPTAGTSNASFTGTHQQQQQQSGMSATTTTSSSSPNSKKGGSLSAAAAAAGPISVPLAQYEAALDESRRLKVLLGVQQAVLNVVTNELDVSDAFRDWVLWKKTMLQGYAELRRVTDSLRVPICSVEDEEELLSEVQTQQQQQQQQQLAEGGEDQHQRSQSRSSSASQSSSGTATGAAAAAVAPETVDSLDATSASVSVQQMVLSSTASGGDKMAAAGKASSPKRENKLGPSSPTQQQQQLQKQHHQQHRRHHELFGPTDVAYRRAVRENLSMQRMLEKVVHRLTLLESSRKM